MKKETRMKSSKQLVSSQVKVLHVVFRFRFISTELIAKVLCKDRSTVYERLELLVKQEYLEKQYSSSYKLAGKPATYSLSTKGIRTLLTSTEHNFPRAGLRNMYRNNSVTTEYIDHCVLALKIYLILRQRYDNSFLLSSKHELAGDAFFPRTKPDFYIRSKDPVGRVRYMLDIFDNGANFMTRRKRLKSLFAHEDSGDWPNAIGTYTNFLFIVANDTVQRRFMKEVAYYYDHSYVDERSITTFVTTLEKLNSNEQNIWQMYESDPDEDEPTPLRTL